ncbi:MAG TPA: hypothetical protein VFE36_12515 [Candidatus Baltobacteraceae bacterium]|jgi:hypothetical protein|nr:hypothetical protein [Candidatus Baltobacteraceae bacterium]
MGARFCILAVSAVALLAGCSGAGGGSVPNVRGAFVTRVTATPQALIFAGMSVNGQDGVGEFRRGAVGNVEPMRKIAFSDILVSLLRADSADTFWGFFRKRNSYDNPTYYAVHFSSTFKVLGTVTANELTSAAVDRKGNVYGVVVDDNIAEYAAGSYGKKVLRQLTLPCCVASPPALTVDAKGNLYASQYPSTHNSSQLNIAVWGRSASGPAPPKLQIPIGAAAPSEMRIDAAGNLYAEFATYGIANGIWRYAKGSTTPEWFLAGLPVAAFDVDGAGNVYAEVPTIGNDFALEVFSPSGQMIAKIAGAKTRLGFPTGIAVTP